MPPLPRSHVVVYINPGSDGDPSKWPVDGSAGGHHGLHWIKNTEGYREKLALRWMTERGLAESGVPYILDRLPDGYALFGKRRENDIKHLDQYLYGHPSYRFRSVYEFYDHFKCLMDNGNANHCTCLGCAKRHPAVVIEQKKGPLRQLQNGNGGSTSSAPTSWFSELHVGKPKKRKRESAVLDLKDDEGVPDIYNLLVERLRAKNTLDVSIEEERSPDWVSERNLLADHIASLRRQPRFIPRPGEVVLFARNVGEGESICFNDSTGTYNVRKRGGVTVTPRWEAGVVTQTPEESIAAEDLTMEKGKEYNVNYSGFRIEPLSEVGAYDKPLTKQYKYVPLHMIRPFIFYADFFKGIDRAAWHASIHNAMSIMSSFTLLDKYHFKGVWPSATIFTKGIYIGSELLLQGDTVRLLPNKLSDPLVTDILHITAIKMKLINLDGPDTLSDLDEDEPDDDPPAYNVCIHLSGHAYTTDPTRAWGMGKLAIRPELQPPGVQGYGNWYHLHNPKTRWEVPFSRIMGRCFETEAMERWFPASSTAPAPSKPSFSATTKTATSGKRSVSATNANGIGPDLSKSLDALLAARDYATTHDSRIRTDEGKTWFWADSRVEQLDLHEVNGTAVGLVSERNLPAWKRAMNLRKGARGMLPLPKSGVGIGNGGAGRGKGSEERRISAAGLGMPNQRFARSGLVDGALDAVADAEGEGEGDVEIDSGDDDGVVGAGEGMDGIELDGSENENGSEEGSGEESEEESGDDEEAAADRMVEELALGAIDEDMEE